MRVLLIEDHPSMREMTGSYLREKGFVVDEVPNGADALAAVMSTAYDAVVLDLGLPDMDGTEVLRAIRAERGAGVPTLILTARDRIEDRVGALDGGADDYIVKPFDLSELEARLRAVLRRPGARQASVHRFGELTFDPGNRWCCAGSVALDLTRREASVLEELIRANGRIVVKDALEDRIYGFDEEVTGNALEAAVSRVRRKLAAAASSVSIETCRGLGYRLSIVADDIRS